MLREDKSFGEIVQKSLLAMPQDQVSEQVVTGVLGCDVGNGKVLVLVSDVWLQRLAGVREPFEGEKIAQMMMLLQSVSTKPVQVMR